MLENNAKDTTSKEYKWDFIPADQTHRDVDIQKNTGVGPVVAYANIDDTKNNNGLLINPSNGSSTYTITELGSSIKYLIEGLDENDFTKPVKVESNEGSIYRILNVVDKISSHTANLDLDYDFFQTQALNFKKQEKLDDWIDKRIKNTYVELKEMDKNCKSRYKW